MIGFTVRTFGQYDESGCGKDYNNDQNHFLESLDIKNLLDGDSIELIISFTYAGVVTNLAASPFKILTC